MGNFLTPCDCVIVSQLCLNVINSLTAFSREDMKEAWTVKINKYELFFSNSFFFYHVNKLSLTYSYDKGLFSY